MRELKFRAWDKERKQFNFIGKTVLDLAVWYAKTEGKDNPFYGTDGELEQFTGKKDDNKKDIYKGDLFRTSDKHGYSSDCLAEVIRLEDDACFAVQLYRKDDLEITPELLSDFKRNFSDSFVVIGNIHQNPELMESDNE